MYNTIKNIFIYLGIYFRLVFLTTNNYKLTNISLEYSKSFTTSISGLKKKSQFQVCSVIESN